MRDGRVRVNATWGTRTLLLVALLVSGAIALVRFWLRDEAPRPRRTSDPNVVEVEIVSDPSGAD